MAISKTCPECGGALQIRAYYTISTEYPIDPITGSIDFAHYQSGKFYIDEARELHVECVECFHDQEIVYHEAPDYNNYSLDQFEPKGNPS